MIMDGSLHLHIYFYGIAWTLPCNNHCTMWLCVAWELELNLWLVYLWTLLVSLMFYQFGLWFNSYMNLWLIPLASCCYLGCVCVCGRARSCCLDLHFVGDTPPKLIISIHMKNFKCKSICTYVGGVILYSLNHESSFYSIIPWLQWIMWVFSKLFYHISLFSKWLPSSINKKGDRRHLGP
jgi:hypothetical protein